MYAAAWVLGDLVFVSFKHLCVGAFLITPGLMWYIPFQKATLPPSIICSQGCSTHSDYSSQAFTQKTEKCNIWLIGQCSSQTFTKCLLFPATQWSLTKIIHHSGQSYSFLHGSFVLLMLTLHQDVTHHKKVLKWIECSPKQAEGFFWGTFFLLLSSHMSVIMWVNWEQCQAEIGTTLWYPPREISK